MLGEEVFNAPEKSDINDPIGVMRTSMILNCWENM